MSQARPIPPPPNPPIGLTQGRAALPSWLLSLVFHLGLMLLLGLTLRLSPPRGAAAERTAEVGIVLKHSDGDTEFFETADDAGGSQAEAAAPSAASLDEMLADQPPADPSEALPASLPIIGLGGLESGGGSSADGAANGGPSGARRGVGGTAKTGIFGVEGEGYKFVYVFDRSYSMGGSGRSPLSAAKAELIASIQSLDKVHQFQVIFYNEQRKRFLEQESPNKLFFANDRNKKLAEGFIRGITAQGGTQHEDALLLAIRLQPDVIFFLTDADKPILWPGQLANIKRRAKGIVINAIEFGYGPPGGNDNFLKQLARDNGGQHGYVDVTRFRTGSY